MIFNPVIVKNGTKLPALTNPGTAADLLTPKQLIDQDGNALTGTIQTKTASDLTASGATVTVPAGYYASAASKSVTTATQATPSITVGSTGLITASSTQTAGYVAAGTKSATKQLTTKAASTITPGTTNKTIASGTYLTGTQTIKGDANLIAANIKSGVSIFGVAGSFVGGMNYWSTEISAVDSSGIFNWTCGFQPSGMIACCTSLTSGWIDNSESAETNHITLCYLYIPTFTYYEAGYNVPRSRGFTDELTASKFTRLGYEYSVTSTGMTWLMPEGTVFDGDYTIILFG